MGWVWDQSGNINWVPGVATQPSTSFLGGAATTGTGPTQGDVTQPDYGQPIQTQYNSNLFADDATAKAIAAMIPGATVTSAPLREAGGGTPASPWNMPNANYIVMPNGAVENAGTLAQWAQQYGVNSPVFQQMLQQEISGDAGAARGSQANTGAGYWYNQYTPPSSVPSYPTAPVGTKTAAPATGATGASAANTSQPSTATTLGGARRNAFGMMSPRYSVGDGVTDATTPASTVGQGRGAGITYTPSNPISQADIMSRIQGIQSIQPVSGSTGTDTTSTGSTGTGSTVGGGRTGTDATGVGATYSPPAYRPPATSPTPPTTPTTPTVPTTPTGTGTTIPSYLSANGSTLYPPGTTPPTMFPTWATGDTTNGAYVGGDPGFMASSLANRAQDYGNIFEGAYGNAYTQAMAQSQGYQGQADTAYNLLNQTPGYTADEQANITGEAGLYGAMTTPDQYASNYLTGTEQAGMLGNPNAATNAFNPQDIVNTATAGNQWTKDQYANSYAAAQRALAQGETSAQGTLGDYGNRLRGAVGTMGANVNSALGASDQALQGNLAQTRTDYANIIDPNKLGISDARVAELKDQAGRQIGLNYAAAQDQMQRQAEAAGNVNPLALAAARQRLVRDQSIQNADAVTNADIAAREAQRNANLQIAGLGMTAATNVGQMGQAAAEFTGAQNVGAQQALGTAGMGAESELGQAGLNTGLSLAGLRTGTESAYGTLGANVGATTNAQQTGAVSTAGNTAIGQAQYADTNAAARNAAIAQNRQATNLSNQQQTYNQGYNTNNAVSQRYQSVGQQRIAGQQAARNYYQGQSQYQGNQANAASANRISGAQTSLSGMGQGGATAANAKASSDANAAWRTLIGRGL